MLISDNMRKTPAGSGGEFVSDLTKMEASFRDRRESRPTAGDRFIVGVQCAVWDPVIFRNGGQRPG